MKMNVTIICDCGNKVEKELTRTTHENKGKVYEDFFSFEDSFDEDPQFNIHQSHPDETRITCLKCNNLVDFFL